MSKARTTKNLNLYRAISNKHDLVQLKRIHTKKNLQARALRKRQEQETAIMADKLGNDIESESDNSPMNSPGMDPQDDADLNNVEPIEKLPKSAMKKSAPREAIPAVQRPELPPQTNPADLVLNDLSPLTPEIIARQATINIGTIGHVAHGKSTVVKAISGVQTVRFKNELERNITIKLGYANVCYYIHCGIYANRSNMENRQRYISATTNLAQDRVATGRIRVRKRLTHHVKEKVVRAHTDYCAMFPSSIARATIFS